MTIPDYSERPPEARRPMLNLRGTDTSIPREPLDLYDVYAVVEYLADEAGVPPSDERTMTLNAITVVLARALGVSP